MATNKAQLETIKSQTLQIMVDITANPKPTYTIDGQTMQWSDYLAKLRETVNWYNRQLGGEDPFEIASRGIS